jgi:hypothetical protein
VRFDSGYTVALADLRRAVELAEALTLGAVCESLARMESRERAALEAVLGYPLQPWLDDCLRREPEDRASDDGASEASLVAIHLTWRCVCWGDHAIGGHSPTQVSLEVLGIGDLWSSCRPGGPGYREGAPERRDYALDFTPLATLRHLPLRLDPVMEVQVAGPSAAGPETIRSLPAPETTLLDLLAGLFDAFTHEGSLEARDREQAELMREDEEPEPGEWITLQQYLVEREARRRGPG